jgi:hypothetical protein
MTKLKINKRYTVVNVQRSNTQFGTAIRIDIKDGADRSVCVFLPERYTAGFGGSDIQRIDD